MDRNINIEKEEPIHAYGSTTSSNSNPVSGTTNVVSDSEIQLSDFKGPTMKDSLLSDKPQPSSLQDKKVPPRPSSLHALLNKEGSCDRRSNYSDSSFDQNDSWIRHPKVRENWRIVLASGFLTLLGLALLATGVVIAFTPQRGLHCLIIGLIGLLCVIPGGYHFIYIYCAASGRPGYHFENLPVLR